MRRLRAVAALGLVLDVAGVSGRTDASLWPDIGVRAMAIDGGGRLWYAGSHRGTLGEIE
jgi:hypothetical protein